MRAPPEIIEAVQALLDIEVDGDAGMDTWSAIYRHISGKEWDVASRQPPVTATPEIPQAAIDLILESEGIDQPTLWPGGDSGITLGYGCDIGADPDSLEFWRGTLSDLAITHLGQAKGKTGEAARDIQRNFVGIFVTKDQALHVFLTHTLPREVQRARAALPGIERFPLIVLGAMVSLGYNRGWSFEGDRRREMASIRSIIGKTNPENSIPDACRAIAREIEAMKRLWEGTGQNGLLVRRDREARMVLNAIT